MKIFDNYWRKIVIWIIVSTIVVVLSGTGTTGVPLWPCALLGAGSLALYLFILSPLHRAKERESDMPINVGVDAEAKPMKWHFSVYGETTVSLPFAELVGHTMNDLLESEVDSETAIEHLEQYEADWGAGMCSVEVVLREICEDFPRFVLPAVLQMLADIKVKKESE